MVTEVVIDSSVIIALVTIEEYSIWARQKISEHGYFHILDLSYYEVANALKYKQSQKLSSKETKEAFTQAIELMNLFGVHSFGEVVVDALSLALELNIAVYDAAFLYLADKLDIRLLTLDLKLAKRLENTRYRGFIEYPNK
jgi:predicted nucleic acid-binding protein